jgi:hypothetical protein
LMLVQRLAIQLLQSYHKSAVQVDRCSLSPNAPQEGHISVTDSSSLSAFPCSSGSTFGSIRSPFPHSCACIPTGANNTHVSC